MYCSICNYNWCWTCGFAVDHWFHNSIFFFQGFFCRLHNLHFFGFEDQKWCHWSIRWSLSLLMVPTAPVWLLGWALIQFVFLTILNEYAKMPFLLLCIQPPRNSTLYWYVYFPLHSVQYLVMLGVWMAAAAVVEAVLIVPFYVIWLIVGLRIFFRFCTCKKFKASNSKQVALVLKYKSKYGLWEDIENTFEDLDNKESVLKLLQIPEKEESDEESLEDTLGSLNKTLDKSDEEDRMQKLNIRKASK